MSHADVTSVPIATLPDRWSWLIGAVLLAAATFVSGSFLLHPTDLHLPACSEPRDAAIYPWNFFWAHDALGADDGSILFTQRIYYPRGEGLALYTPTYMYGLLSLPFQWLGSGPEARNVAVAALLLFSSIATAFLAFLLARQLAIGRAGALLFALLFTVASGRMMNGARLNLFCTEFLLLHAWLALRLLERGGHWQGFLVGLAATALLLQSQPLFFQAGLATGVVLLGLLARREGRRSLARIRWPLATATGTFLLLAAPFLWEMVKEMRLTPGFAQASQLTPLGSLDPCELLLPNTGDRFGALYQSLFGAVVPGFTPRNPTFFELGGPRGTWSHFLGLGWILLLLVSWSTTSPRRTLGPTLFALALLLLAVGPTLKFCGRAVPVPTLYQLLACIPPLTLEKSPARFVLLVELGLALVAARGVDGLLARARASGRWGRGSVGAVLGALLALVALAEQGDALPLRSIEPPVRIPPEIAALRDEPGKFAVLDLPYDGIPPTGHLSYRVNALAMAFAAFHERPIFFGLYPRAARLGEAELSARPLFAEIHRLEKEAEEQVKGLPFTPTPTAAAAIAAAQVDLAELPIGAVLLHDLADAPPAIRAEVALLRGLLRQLGPREEKELAPGKGYSVTLFRF